MKKIEVLRAGRKQDETFVVLVDGREIDDKLPHATAQLVAEFLRRNITQLEEIL